MSGHNPGDIVLGGAMLFGPAGSVDITYRLQSFQVYENMKKPYTSITAVIKDVSDIMNWNIGLDGTNKFTLAFGQPGQDMYKGEWILTSVEESRSNDNLRVAYYTVTGYSPHMTKSELPKVQRAYRDVTYSDVVKDLVGSFLKPSKPLEVRAPARNMVGNKRMPFNVNGLQIFKAIKLAMTSAASAKDKSSAYVLFENNKNLVLDTLENALANAGNGPTYHTRPLGGDFLLDVARQQFTILNYKEHSRADATAQIQDKTQDVRIVDMFSQKFQNKLVGAGSAASSFASIAYNAARPPSFAQEFLPARKSMAGNFDSQSLTILVPLNPGLTVGSGFNAEILAPPGDTETIKLAKCSGAYLITEVVHIVDFTKKKMQGRSSVRGSRGGVV